MLREPIPSRGPGDSFLRSHVQETLKPIQAPIHSGDICPTKRFLANTAIVDPVSSRHIRHKGGVITTRFSQKLNFLRYDEQSTPCYHFHHSSTFTEYVLLDGYGIQVTTSFLPKPQLSNVAPN